MHATITLDDQLYLAAQRAAAEREVAVDDFVADLVRQATRQPTLKLRERNGLPVFDVGPDATPFTSEDVRRAEDEP